MVRFGLGELQMMLMASDPAIAFSATIAVEEVCLQGRRYDSLHPMRRKHSGGKSVLRQVRREGRELRSRAACGPFLAGSCEGSGRGSATRVQPGLWAGPT